MNQEQIEQMFNGRWRMKNYILENIDGKAAKEIARDFFEAGILLGQGEHCPPIPMSAITVFRLPWKITRCLPQPCGTPSFRSCF